MIRDAVRRYTELLSTPNNRLAETRDLLVNGMREADLDFGGRVLSPYLRPHFVSQTQWDMVTGACEGIWECIRIVGELVKTDTKLVEELGMTEAELKLIAIVDWNDVPTQAEFRLFQRYFVSQGYDTIIADPRDLEFTNGRLRHKGTAIDIVYKRLLTNEFLEKLDETHALLDAYHAGAVCVVNSFRQKYIHEKMLFGIL